jgi:hypothetical protein
MNLKNFVGKLSVYFTYLNRDTNVQGATVSVGEKTGIIRVQKNA